MRKKMGILIRINWVNNNLFKSNFSNLLSMKKMQVYNTRVRVYILVIRTHTNKTTSSVIEKNDI